MDAALGPRITAFRGARNGSPKRDIHNSDFSDTRISSSPTSLHAQLRDTEA